MEDLVGRTGLEPVTSALSKQRSEPTELTSRGVKFKTILFYFIFYSLLNINLNIKFGRCTDEHCLPQYKLRELRIGTLSE